MLHQRVSTPCGLEGLSCFFFNIPADVDLVGEYDGSGPTVFEHIMLTFRISEQQCCLEIYSVS